MAQRVFGTVGAAADDVAAVFGKEASDLSAAFLVWALQETERCVLVFQIVFFALFSSFLFPFFLSEEASDLLAAFLVRALRETERCASQHISIGCLRFHELLK